MEVIKDLTPIVISCPFRYVRDPYIMFANRRSGRTQRNVTGDGMIPLPITRCLARGEFILHVPKQFVASGLLPRFPYGLNAIKEGPIVDIEKAMQVRTSVSFLLSLVFPFLSLFTHIRSEK